VDIELPYKIFWVDGATFLPPWSLDTLFVLKTLFPKGRQGVFLAPTNANAGHDNPLQTIFLWFARRILPQGSDNMTNFQKLGFICQEKEQIAPAGGITELHAWRDTFLSL